MWIIWTTLGPSSKVYKISKIQHNQSFPTGYGTCGSVRHDQIQHWIYIPYRSKLGKIEKKFK